MFGDTWANFLCESIQPDADDALGKISLRDFPDGDSVERWVTAHPPKEQDAPRFHAAAPTLSIVVDESGRSLPMRPSRDGVSLTSGPALTPTAGFSNARSGDAAGAFGIFLRSEPLQCDDHGGCGDTGFSCDAELGQCAPLSDVSPPCVLGTKSCTCQRVGTGRGLCQDRTVSVYDAGSERGRTQAVVMRQPVGNALRSADNVFASQSWDTRRFYNATVRTVRDFDQARVQGEGNDYRPADGVRTKHDGVFVWGRPGFGGVRSLNRDAQLYLAFVPMPTYDESGHFTWQPRYFAGMDDDGRPRFVDEQVDAAALDLDADTPSVQPQEQHDLVGQMSVAYVPELARFVMFYGGGIGTSLSALIFWDDLATLQLDPGGSIYVRFAEQPWGPWTKPAPLLVGGNPDDGPVVQYGPGGLLHHDDCTQRSCAPGEPGFFLQNHEMGRLYAPNIIEQWTEARGAGEVDLYWHVSTWNPYQVVLMRTRLTAP